MSIQILFPFLNWIICLSIAEFKVSLYIVVIRPILGLQGGSVVKNLPVNAGDTGSIPGSGRSSGGGNDGPLQHSCLGNPMDRGYWHTTGRGVTRARYDLAFEHACTQKGLGGNLFLQKKVDAHTSPLGAGC